MEFTFIGVERKIPQLGYIVYVKLGDKIIFAATDQRSINAAHYSASMMVDHDTII